MRPGSDGTLRLSPSDLSAHLACPHLTTLSLRVARGELVQPHLDSPHRDLIFRKGNEHEQAYLARLVAEGRSIVRIPTYDDEAFDAGEARRLTEEAIRAGAADVIYQPYLVDEKGRWRGFADFLERLPDGTYEPVDTKLARSRQAGTRPAALLLRRAGGADPGRAGRARPRRERTRRARDVPGGRVRGVLPAGPRAVPRRARRRAGDVRLAVRPLRDLRLPPALLRAAGRGRPPHARRRAAPLARGDADRGGRDDARGARGAHVARRTGARRAQAESFEAIRQQAALQLRGRRTGTYLWELLPDEPERGFRLLPAPDEGDVWFDIEGHPFYETSRGLEYLFGYCFRDASGEVVYEALWGRDRDGEREIFERFVDWLVERRRRHPGMHVYHYAAYERTALTRLMGEHGTREDEVDDFLREEVLVDLYRIVKQSLRASLESYSIKAVEKLYGFERTADVSGGDESVVRFEEWVETGEDAMLADVERYNEEDCRSTVALHEWLLSLRPRGPALAPSARAAPADRGGGGARRRAGGARGRAARGRRGGVCRGGCSATSSTTTSARRGPSGGRGSAGRSSTTTSWSATGRRSGGSSTTARRRRSRARATRTG